MRQTFRLTFLKDNRTADVTGQQTLMEALKQAGIFLDAPCGGQGTCGKCLVRISPDGDSWQEVKACQTKITSDLWVDIGKSAGNHRILTTSSIRKVSYAPSLPENIDLDSLENYYLAAFDIGSRIVAMSFWGPRS